jgi:hypothetical protein
MWKWTVFAAAVLAGGCAKFDLRKNIPWGPGADGRIEQPLRVEAAWVDTVLTRAEEKPTRGFGGRLYFFGPNNSQEPVKVDGTLVVYVFNEANRDPANVVPDRKVVYPVKQFETLYSKSKLGHSYSVWVPWDEAGGPRTEISLIARFIPKKGAVITSEQMRVLLPGTDPLVNVRNVNSSPDPVQVTGSVASGDSGGGGVQLASFQQPGAASQTAHLEDQKTRQISTYTIPLRGTQAQYFMQRPMNVGEQGMGVSNLPEVAPGGAANPSANQTPPAAQNPPQSAAVQPAAPQAEPVESQSPTPHLTGQPAPQQLSARFEPLKPPVRATLTAPPRFSRARWEQRPQELQSYLALSPSPATSLPPPGSAPGAAQPSKPELTGRGAASQILR